MGVVNKRTKKSELKAQCNSTPETKDVTPSDDLEYIPLSIVESVFYWSAWVGIVGYIMYLVYKVSNVYEKHLHPEDLADGWKTIVRKKDVSDVEWEFWVKYKELSCIAFGVYVVGGQTVSRFLPKYKSVYCVSFTLLFLSMVIGILPVIYLLVQSVVFYICALSGHVVLVWMAAIASLASLQFESIRTWQFQYLTNHRESSDFTLFVSLMAILRCVSFSLECCWKDKDKASSSTSYSLLDLLTYNFYLPLFNNGPVMTYSNFNKQLHQPRRPFSKPELFSIAWDAVTTFFWFLFLEIYLHYMYSSALIHNAHIVRGLSGWAFSGLFYSQLHIFLTKYVVLYRFSATFARFDGLDPPKAPRCVSSLYTFTDMWRYFDRGLNVWMKRYIYIPMGGSRRGMLRQALGSFVAFAFVWAWHGGYYDTVWWFVPNWLGVAVEGWAAVLRKHPTFKRFKECVSQRMYRRLHVMSCTIPFACLILSNMVFLVGLPPVQFYIYKIFYRDFPVSSLVCLSTLYASIQTSIDISYYKSGKW